jgi:NlpC/P60 family
VPVALGGVGVGGVGRQVAAAAPHDTPATKIARLRARAARVQAAIDRMNARVESLVEDYNQVREALARTRVEQARTRRQVLAIYTGGAPSTLGQLLGAEDIHQAPVATRYQEQVVEADRTCGGRPVPARTTGRPGHGRLPPRRGVAAQGQPGPVERRPPRRPGQPGPGDLVFFAYNRGNPSTIHHVGMYVGGGAMIEDPYSGASVRIASIGRGDYIGAVRPTG